jgi:type II secretory pathway pseudopilin PulG
MKRVYPASNLSVNSPETAGSRFSRARGRRGDGSRAGGFTLVEIMVVLSIIILILAVGMPVWHAMTGNNSVAAAQNQVAAALANARGDAIYHRQTIGVLFFIDPVNDQTAMAEVQVQTLYQYAYAPSGGAAPTSYSMTPLFQPQDSTGPFDNGAVYSLERVNYPDPNTPPPAVNLPGTYVFYRDIILLPKGVGVALNNDTFTYNAFNTYNLAASVYPALDRYRRLGCIMFAPDGTLTSLPFGIPYHEMFDPTYVNSPIFTAKPPGTANLVCLRLGFPIQFAMSSTPFDVGSNVVGPTISGVKQLIPLRSSPGLVIFDRDAYKSQRCQWMNPATNTVIGDGLPFNEWDLNYYLFNANSSAANNEMNLTNYCNQYATSGSPAPAADKFIEEQWIDQNGVALLVSPFNGELIKAK